VNGAKAPVPRHGEIDNRLARKICEQLGISLYPLIWPPFSELILLYYPRFALAHSFFD
jgi:hypothetical protein